MVVCALNVNLEISPPQRFLSPQVLIKQQLRVHANVSYLNVAPPPLQGIYLNFKGFGVYIKTTVFILW